MSFNSDTAELIENPTSIDIPSSPTPKGFLSKLTLRKPSILSLSSVASSPGSASPSLRRAASPMQDEEKRKILKMLISPNSERKPSKDINDFMMIANQTIKAAKSAENLSTNNQVLWIICEWYVALGALNLWGTYFKSLIPPDQPYMKRYYFQVLRQESSLSLQVPIPSIGQRKVTFSQVRGFCCWVKQNWNIVAGGGPACLLTKWLQLPVWYQLWRRFQAECQRVKCCAKAEEAL